MRAGGQKSENGPPFSVEVKLSSPYGLFDVPTTRQRYNCTQQVQINNHIKDDRIFLLLYYFQMK